MATADDKSMGNYRLSSKGNQSNSERDVQFSSDGQKKGYIELQHQGTQKMDMLKALKESDDSHIEGFLYVMQKLSPLVNGESHGRYLARTDQGLRPESSSTESLPQRRTSIPGAQALHPNTRIQPIPSHFKTSESSLSDDSIFSSQDDQSVLSVDSMSSAVLLNTECHHSHPERRNLYDEKQFLARWVTDEVKQKWIKAFKVLPPKRKGCTIHIQGKPGMGKSWLLDWFMDQWSHQGLKEKYPCIFLLDVAYLSSLRTPLTLTTLLTKHSSYRANKDLGQLPNWIESGFRHIVLLFDNVDALPENTAVQHESDSEFKALASDWCMEILHGNLLPDCHKITTSTVPLRLYEVSKYLVLSDLTLPCIKAMVKSHVPADELDHVLSTLMDEDVLLSLSGNPRICSILCDLLKGCDLQSLSYTRIIAHLLMAIPNSTTTHMLKGKTVLTETLQALVTHGGRRQLQDTKDGKSDSKSDFIVATVTANECNVLQHSGIVYLSQRPAHSVKSILKAGFGFVHNTFAELLSAANLLMEPEPDIELFFSTASQMSRNFLVGLTQDTENSGIMTLTGAITQLDGDKLKETKRAVRRFILHHFEDVRERDGKGVMDAMQLLFESQSEDIAKVAAKLLHIKPTPSAKVTAIGVEAREFLMKHGKGKESTEDLERQYSETMDAEKEMTQWLTDGEVQLQILEKELDNTADITKSAQKCREERLNLESKFTTMTAHQRELEDRLMLSRRNRKGSENNLFDIKGTEDVYRGLLKDTEEKTKLLEKQLTAIMKIEASLIRRLKDMEVDIITGKHCVTNCIEERLADIANERDHLQKTIGELEERGRRQSSELGNIRARISQAGLELKIKTDAVKNFEVEMEDLEKRWNDLRILLRDTSKGERHLKQKQVDRQLLKNAFREKTEAVEVLEDRLRIHKQSTKRLQKKIKESKASERPSIRSHPEEAGGDYGVQPASSIDIGLARTLERHSTTCKVDAPKPPTNSPQNIGILTTKQSLSLVREDVPVMITVNDTCQLRCIAGQLAANDIDKITNAVSSHPSLSSLQIETLPIDCVQALEVFITKKRRLKTITSILKQNTVCLEVFTSDCTAVIYFANRERTAFQLPSACLQDELDDFLTEKSIPSGIDFNNKKLVLFVTKEQEFHIGPEIRTRITAIEEYYGDFAEEYELVQLDHELEIHPQNGHGIFSPGCTLQFECSDGSTVSSSMGPMVKDDLNGRYVLSSCHGKQVYHSYLVKETESETHRERLKYVRCANTKQPFLDVCLLEIDNAKLDEKCDPCVTCALGKIELHGPYNGSMEDLNNAQVMKYGARSKLTTGRISLFRFKLPSANIGDALIVVPGPGSAAFTEDGDSGSVVFRQEGCEKDGVLYHEALGMHSSCVTGFKGIKWSLACRLDVVLDTFGRIIHRDLKLVTCPSSTGPDSRGSTSSTEIGNGADRLDSGHFTFE